MVIPHSINRLLSNPIVIAVMFITAVVALNTWQLILPHFHYDNSFSIAAAKNIADGKGFTITHAFTNDLSAAIHEPINKWPPGYSWLVAGAMKIFSTDTITAVYLVNGLSILLFMAGIYLMLSALRFPAWTISLFVLYAGFFPYSFLGYWFSDLVAVAFITLAIALVLHASVTNRRVLVKSVIAALLCSYCIFLKYLYLPVAILPLIVWAWYSLRTRQMKQFRFALLGAAIVTGAALLLVLYQSTNSGKPVYVNPTGRGFFPSHALKMGPLIPASLVDQEFLTTRLARILGIRYGQAHILLGVVNYVALLACMVLLFQWWRKSFRSRRNLYVYMVLVISAATTGMLLFLSLTFAPYRSEFVLFWTFLQELRYYGVVILFIQQLLFWYFIVRDSQSQGFLYKAMRVIMLCIVIGGIVHGAYHLLKKGVVKGEIGTNKKNEQTSLVALDVISKLRRQYPNLVICSNYEALANIGSISGVPVLSDHMALNTPLKTSKPVMLLAILRNDYLGRYTPFLQAHKPVKVGEHYNFSFYLAAIQ